MLSHDFAPLKRGGFSRAPEILLALYCLIYFVPNITRYKGLVLILLLVGGIVMLWQKKAQMRPMWRQTLPWALVLLSAAVIYSCFISLNGALSLHTAITPIFVDCLLVGLLWPMILHETPVERVAWSLIGGFTGGLFVMLVLDAFHYYQDFVGKGLQFGSNFDHRELSYCLLVCLPFAMVALRYVRGLLKYLVIALLVSLTVSLIGTLARGAWLAAGVVLALWVVHYRAWKPAAIIVLVVVAFAAAWVTLQPGTSLAGKFKQTDSSQRWNGGVQSAAVDLILESPWRGYGFGDEIYADVYNRRVADHPEWIVRSSIGPHNMVMRMWFACGIAGLAAILALYLAIYRTSRRLLRETSGIVHDASFAVFLAFVGAVFMRGLFEIGYMNYLGWMAGMLTTFSLSRRAGPPAEKLPLAELPAPAPDYQRPEEP